MYLDYSIPFSEVSTPQCLMDAWTHSWVLYTWTCLSLLAPTTLLLINREKKITLPDHWRFTVQLHNWMVFKFSSSCCFASEWHWGYVMIMQINGGSGSFQLLRLQVNSASPREVTQGGCFTLYCWCGERNWGRNLHRPFRIWCICSRVSNRVTHSWITQRSSIQNCERSSAREMHVFGRRFFISERKLFINTLCVASFLTPSDRL